MNSSLSFTSQPSTGLEKALFIFFSLFVLAQCLSNVIANTFLGISVFLAVVYLIRELPRGLINRLKIFFQRYKGFFVAFLFFWIVMLLSGLASEYPLVGFKTFFGAYVYKTIPFFMILFFFRNKRMAIFLLSLAVFSCVTDILISIGLAEPGTSRLKGIFGHPMTLAGFLCVSFPVVTFYFFDWKQSWKSLMLVTITFFVLFLGCLLNGTRGAWIALVPSLFIVGTYCAFRSTKKKIFFLLLIGLTTLTVFLNPRIQDRIESIGSKTMQSNTERLLMWQSATNMFKDHPVLGVGVGQYKDKYIHEYILPEAKERDQRHAHSNIFQMLGQSGALGLISFLYLFGYIFYYGLKLWVKGSNPYGMLIFATTLSFFIQGLTEFNFGNSAVVKYYWVALACLIVLGLNKENVSLSDLRFSDIFLLNYLKDNNK